MPKFFDNPTLVMGIIEPLSMLPYFRVYSFKKDAIFDVPCCTWMLRGRAGSFDSSREDIHIWCQTNNFPAYVENTWNNIGYYIIDMTDTQIKIIDLMGNKSVISYEEAARLAKVGQIFNVTTRNYGYTPPLMHSFQAGDIRYYVITLPVELARICSTKNLRAYNDFIIARSKMLGVQISSIGFDSCDYFGRRVVFNIDIMNTDTFIAPQGLTDIVFNCVIPQPHNVIINNPGFWFTLSAHYFHYDDGSFIITDAYKVENNGTLYCTLFKARTLNADLYLDKFCCQKLMLWGSYACLERGKAKVAQGYFANLYLAINSTVREIVLYHVVIHSENVVRIAPDAKFIICDCVFADEKAKTIVMKQAVVISEQEMRALWNLSPSVFEKRLIIPGV